MKFSPEEFWTEEKTKTTPLSLSTLECLVKITKVKEVSNKLLDMIKSLRKEIFKDKPQN